MTRHRLLVAVDGSEPAERAVRHVIGLASAGMSLRVVLLNVQPEWAPPRSKQDEMEGKRLHARAAERATRRARALLEAAKIPHEARMRVGPAAENIVKVARATRCRGIVMGLRGRSALVRVVLGSVSLKTLQLADLPVTLVK
jgi:nucleotide-binding universal stress UspA family protein